MLNDGGRLENLMILFHMVHDRILKKLKPKDIVSLSKFWTSQFADDRKQFHKPSKDKGKPHRGLGISESDTVYDVELHTSALGRVEPKAKAVSGYDALRRKHDVPLVGGPSGSAVSVMRVGLFAGLSSPEEKKQFLLAIIVYLVGGGQHSVAEVLHGIAKEAKFQRYRIGSYAALLPKSLLELPEFKLLAGKYKNYIQYILKK